MIQYRKKFKEISLDEYKKGIKGMSEFEILFSPYHKELNFSKLVPINGKGLLDYIHRENEERNKSHNDKDFLYYREDGYETVVLVGSNSIECWEKFLEDDTTK